MNCEICDAPATLTVTYRREAFELFGRSFAGFDFVVPTCKDHHGFVCDAILGTLRGKLITESSE